MNAHEKLHELWYKAMNSSELELLYIRLDIRSYAEVMRYGQDDRSVELLPDGKTKWRGLPVIKVTVPFKLERMFVTEKVNLKEATPEQRCLTVVAKKDNGRIAYFDDPGNAKEFM